MVSTETLYWFFSTVPQVIAALTGLSFAAMTFKSSKIDEIIAKDDTKSEILEELKKLIYKSFKIMIIPSIFFIAYDLLLLYGIEWLSAHIIIEHIAVDFFLSGNLVVLILQVVFPLTISNPSYQKEAVENLIKDSNYKPGTVDASTFIMDFRELEKAIREKAQDMDGVTEHPSVRMLANYLKSKGSLSFRDVNDISNLSRLRNLMIHEGAYDTIEQELDQRLKELTNKVKNIPSTD